MIMGCTGSPPPEALPWGRSLGLALEAANQQERRVLVSFDASWCTICTRMKRDTFTDADVQTALKSFVLVSVDVDAQPHVARRYQIDAVPQQLILRADGSAVARAVGYLDVRQMTRFLDGNGAVPSDTPAAAAGVIQ